MFQGYWGFIANLIYHMLNKWIQPMEIKGVTQFTKIQPQLHVAKEIAKKMHQLPVIPEIYLTSGFNQ